MLALGACGLEPPFEAVAVATVSVTPGAAQLIEGDSLQLRATPRDAAGTELRDREIQWSSSDPRMASVQPCGLVRARSVAGTARITAASGAGSGSADVAVTANGAPSVQLLAPTYGAALRGSMVTLYAVAVDPEEGPLAGGAVSWSSNRDGGLGTGDSIAATLSAQTFETGVHRLIVAAVDSRGKGALDTLTVRITPSGVLQELVQSFSSDLDITVPAPAVMPGTSDGLPPNVFGHTAIGVVYLGRGSCPVGPFPRDTVGDDCPTMYRSYLPATVAPPRSLAVLRPAGVLRVAVLIVDHGNTNIAALASTEWPAAQDGVNARHAQLATRLRLPTPIVRFVNTNFIVPAADIGDASDRVSVANYLAGRGISVDGFDVFVSLDLDATTLAGGFAVLPNWVYMGCYFSSCGAATKDFDAAEIQSLAAAVYDHEIGHLWGWEHEWTTCPFPLGGICDGFITAPQLFGWTDVDGDGVPEVLDATPYGTSEDQQGRVWREARSGGGRKPSLPAPRR